jgi:hypothetical protein
MILGGIFTGITGVGSTITYPRQSILPSLNPEPYHIKFDFFMMAVWVVVAVALILGGWKLSRWKK